MTYRSESRGILYTAPPSGDDERTDGPPTKATQDETNTTDAREGETADAPTETLELESTTATTDANWTGTVPADD